MVIHALRWFSYVQVLFQVRGNSEVLAHSTQRLILKYTSSLATQRLHYHELSLFTVLRKFNLTG